MKKIISVLFMAVIFFDVGCSKIITENNVTTTISTETTINNEFQGCNEEEYDKARQDIEVIIQALNSKNTEQVKSIFSNYVKENTHKFDEKVQLVFDMLNGEIENYEETASRCIEAIVKWEERCMLCFTYDIYTEDSKYYLDVYYLPRTDTELDNNGVYLINLRDYEENTIYYQLSEPSICTMGGVFSSDQNTMDYNANQISSLYREIGYEQWVDLSAAVILNRIGIEKITSLKLIVVDEWKCSEYIITDGFGCGYRVLADECGYVQFVDENGKTILNPDI